MTREPKITASPRRRRLLAALVLNGLGQAACATAVGFGVGHVFTRLIQNGEPIDAGAFALVALGFLAAAACTAALRARERVDAERLGQHYVHALRMRLYDRLAAISPRVLQRHPDGAVMLRFVGDLTQVRQWVSLGLSRLIVGLTTVGGALAALAVLDWVLALAVALVLAAWAAAAAALGRPLRDAVRLARRRRTRLASNVAEQVASLAVVQVSGQVAAERKRVVRQSWGLRRAMIRRARALGLLRGVSEACSIGAPAAVLLVGALEVQAGRVSAGGVVAAMTVAGLIAGALRDLGRVPEYWHGAVVALENTREFLAVPTLTPERRGAIPLPPGPGALEFRDVGVEGSLEGFEAVAEPGAVIAITGVNGAGKSTLLALASRLMDPDTGAILLDGHDLREVTQASLRRAVGMAGPDLPLRRGTIRANVGYRWPEAPQEELRRVFGLTELHTTLRDMPKGADTRIAERGAGLSAGQRARIALARALVGDPRLLLLDEVEAHFDPVAARVVDRVLDDRRGRATTLIVTHRPELLERADAVWRLHEGRLVGLAERR